MHIFMALTYPQIFTISLNVPVFTYLSLQWLFCGKILNHIYEKFHCESSIASKILN